MQFFLFEIQYIYLKFTDFLILIYCPDPEM